MMLATTFFAAALVVPAMPPPEYDDCEVVTNCVFDASRNDAKEFAVRIELEATPSNGVEVVFGRDANGDGLLSRAEETMSVGYDCGEWKVMNIVTGDKFSCQCARLETAPQQKSNASLTDRNGERPANVYTTGHAAAVPFRSDMERREGNPPRAIRSESASGMFRGHHPALHTHQVKRLERISSGRSSSVFVK